MKYLLILFLSGCLSFSQYNKPYISEENIGQTSVGYFNNIEWKCQESVVNEKLVWVECKFHNTSTEPQKLCIEVAYNIINYNTEVTHSKKVCSVVLFSNEEDKNYGAFIKEKRDLLTKNCEASLSSCYMTTKVLDLTNN